MAENNPGGQLEPELAGHLAESMDEVPAPETEPVEAPASANGPKWPDGSGKHKHPKDRGTLHGREHETAVGAIHRTSRPQIPHHD